MSLTKKQKKYIKKNKKKLPIKQISSDLSISEEIILNYLKKISPNYKVQKTLTNQQSIDKQISTKIINFKFLNWLKKYRYYLAMLLILVITGYINTLGNQFVSDDIALAKFNPSLKFNYYTNPIIRVTHWFIVFILYSLGNQPILHHLTNIIFHVLSVWTVFLLIFIFSNLSWAFFTAVLFAVHPILTESVTWISGGIYVQYSFFLLIAFVFYLLSFNNKKNFFISVIFYLLSVTVAPDKAIIFPLILVLFELSRGWKVKNLVKTVPYFTISFLIIGYYIFGGMFQARINNIEQTTLGGGGFDNPFIQIPIAITTYLKVIFLPTSLSFYYSEVSYSQFEYIIYLIIFIIYLFTTLYFYKKQRIIFFWLGFIIIALAPMLTPFRISWLIAERYVYLGSIGIFVFIGWVFYKLSRIEKYKVHSYFIFSAIIIILLLRTIVRNLDWKNEDTLWLATAKTSPSSSQNHNNLGDMYARHNKPNQAIKEFKTAIKLNPIYAEAYHNLANTYQSQSEYNLALENYDKAIALNPNIWQSYNGRAAIFYEKGFFSSAQAEIKKALLVDKNNSDLYANLGIIYVKRNQTKKALEAFETALKIDPDNKKAIVELQKLLK